MITWLYRIALFVLTFGLSPLAYAGNFDSSLLLLLVNISPIVSILFFVPNYFRLPGVYRLIAWALVLGVVLLVLESKYQYGTYVYSYFVIKRFAYCGVALAAYLLASRSEPLTIKTAVDLTFILFFISQILTGRIFGYAFSSDTRTTLAPDALYLTLPFLYYLVRYLKEHRLRDLFVALGSFLLIVILLHRTVISVAVVSAGAVLGLSLIGKVTPNRLPVGRTLLMFALLLGLASPFIGLLPEKKVDSVMASIGGIIKPKEDNTASWRMEQSEHYMSLFPERPIFGWRYDGYDRGEIMPNPDFPAKGTIIHSQYVDQLFNYGLFGTGLNLLLMVSALVVLYRAGSVLSIDHLVLFGYILGGMVFAVSYQLSVNYWAFVGIGLYVGLNWKPVYFTPVETDEQPNHALVLSPETVPTHD